MFCHKLTRSRRRPRGRDWWAYFGSFGDDIFDDDVATLDGTHQPV